MRDVTVSVCRMAQLINYIASTSRALSVCRFDNPDMGPEAMLQLQLPTMYPSKRFKGIFGEQIAKLNELLLA